MKKKLLLTMFLLSTLTSLFAQNGTTIGTDFWLAFGNNNSMGAAQTEMQLKIVATQATAVTLKYMTGAIPDSTFNIPAGGVLLKSLTTQQKNNVYTYGSSLPSDRSLHITSDQPVSVYAFNQSEGSTDATAVLPVGSLGKDYYNASYQPYGSIYFSGFIAIATQPGTTVMSEDGTELYNLLHPGQTVSIYYQNTDLTGRHYTFTKPVAFYTVEQAAEIPIGKHSWDHLYEQMVPTDSWGKRFLVPVTNLGVERIRIVASQNGTNITQTGGTLITDSWISNSPHFSTSLSGLAKGQFVELEIRGAGCYIQSNQPIGVWSYTVGADYSQVPGNIGDPSLAWIPPIEQSVDGTTVAPFIPKGTTTLINKHYALVVTPTISKGQTTLQIGTAPTTALSTSWTDNTDAGYSFSSVEIADGTSAYTFRNPYGVTVMGYGTGVQESYYYLAGAATRNLSNYFTIADTAGLTDTYYSATSPITHTFGLGKNITIKRTLQSSFTAINWFINN